MTLPVGIAHNTVSTTSLPETQYEKYLLLMQWLMEAKLISVSKKEKSVATLSWLQ